MSLQLYRRHTSKCTQHRKRHERTYESDERRRGFQKCACPIHAEGALDRFDRRSTHQIDWGDAKGLVSHWESAHTWDVPVPSTVAVAAPSPVPAGARPGVTIASATAAFVKECEGRKLSASTLRKYRTLTKQLSEYALARGCVYVDQLDPDVVSGFRFTWKDGPRSAAKKLERAKSFFDICVERGWLSKNPMSKLKPPAGASKPANRTPYTDVELQRIFAACRTLPPQKWRNGAAEGVWSGEDVVTFIMLLVATGLRISDAATFTMRHVNGNDVFLFQHKTDRPLSTWIPDELVFRLQSMPLVNGEFPFIGPHSARKETAADLWRRRLNKVFELCGRWDEPPTPHRFRHTFARILLQRGVPPADVAELMGDTEATVLRHYARWVPERQARLSRIVEDAWRQSRTAYSRDRTSPAV